MEKPEVVQMYRVLGVLLGMVTLQVASAQTSMEFACPTPGTKMTTGRGVLTFREQEGFFCNAEGGGVAIDIYALLHSMNAAQKRDPAYTKVIDPVHVEKLWPLVVGKRHEGSATLGQNTFYLEYTVLRLEVIDTPMGPQNTFLVEMKETSTGPYRATQRWWFSPRFRYAIKGEFSNSFGRSYSYQVTAVEDAAK